MIESVPATGQPAAATPSASRHLEDLGQELSSVAATFREGRMTHAPAGATPQDTGDPWASPIGLDDGQAPAFPTDRLPQRLQAMVVAVAEATQTPEDLPAMLGLTVLAAACAKKVAVVIRQGYAEPVNLYGVVALPPANRKSGVFAEMTSQLSEYEQEEAARAAPEIAMARSRREIRERELKRQQDLAGRCKPDQREVHEAAAAELAGELARDELPRATRLLANDATPERLSSLLAENDGRMALFSAEGDVFDIMAGRYSGRGKGPNLGVYLCGHSGDDLRVDRVNRAPEYVRKPALSIGLTVQPHVISTLAAEPGFQGRGLLGRFLYAMPRSMVGHRRVDPDPVPDDVRRRYNHLVRRLLCRSIPRDDQGMPRPRPLAFDGEAYDAWLGFSRWLEPRLAPAGDLGALSDWAGKLAGNVARIAGLLHMAEHADDPTPWVRPVSATTLDSAVEIGRYLIGHARLAFAAMGADPAVADARHVLEHLRVKAPGHPEPSERDMFEWTKGRLKTVGRMRPAVLLLVAHNYLRVAVPPHRTGPGRPPGPIYEVHPVLRSGPSGRPGEAT